MSEAGGLIVAAIIAGVVAYVSLIISKEQSISGFRQQWIDDLRKDIAIIVGCVIRIHGESIAALAGGGEKTFLWNKVKPDFTRLKRVVARIRLRLTPDEKRPKEGEATRNVLDALRDLVSVFDSPQPQFHKLEPLVEKLVSNAQLILKKNWDRVRYGEPIYRGTKWVGLAVAIGAVIYWLYKVICHH
jgi:hypothetical protein